MAFQRISGGGLMIPAMLPGFARGAAFTACASLTALGHKVAIVGDFMHKDRTGSKNITKIHTRIGANSSFVGTVTGYVQGVSTASGPPATPDGSTSSGGAFSTLTASTWQSTAAFGTSATTSIGAKIAVVLEVTAFTSGSIAPTSGLTHVLGSTGYAGTPQTLTNTASWALASQTYLPNLILECDDGTFGTIEGCFPCEAASSVAYNVNTAAADEYALNLNFPFPVKIDAFWASVTSASAVSNFSFVLYYNGGSVVKTIDGNQVTANGNNQFFIGRFDNEYSLLANTDYYLSLRVDGTTSMSLFYFDVNDANHFQAHDGGTAFYMVDRVNAGSWGTTNSNSGKRRPMMGVRVSSLDDGTGGGGLALPVSGRIIV